MQLRLEGIRKQYGEVLALDQINCNFPVGISGILGPNGAGKSTMMNLISDNVKRDVGKIFYNDEDILDLGVKFRSILGYMSQEQGMYDRFTAREFLSYMGHLKAVPKKVLKEQIEDILGRLNLLAHAHRKVGTFSGGMRQRVLLAQALLGEPKILILDEPSAGLDPGERFRMRQFIDELAKDKIVLLSTHIVGDVEDIAKQIVFLKQGRIILTGSPKTLIEERQESSLESLYLTVMEDR